MIGKIRKRDGSVVAFNIEKVSDAVFKAAQSVGGDDRARADRLAGQVFAILKERFPKAIPSVEDVQDAVEKILIEEGHAKTAKAYIIYRKKRDELREMERALLHGRVDAETHISPNALTVLQRRYLLRDEEGNVRETPSEMFLRVAKAVASADRKYGSYARETVVKFYEMMQTMSFLPNSPTLMNAGRSRGQLAASFVLPIDDSLQTIFGTLKNAALLHQSGGGTGFSFSRIRPKGSIVASSLGVASGPVAFMRIYNESMEQVKQGGRRQGANMGILLVNHPDIMEFITAKADPTAMKNFNLSIAATDVFMKAVKENGEYNLVHPVSGAKLASIPARSVFGNIVSMTWRSGDPGLLFIDKINKKNPVKHLGTIEATSPCGEQPLLPYESAVLGSINLTKIIPEKKVDWKKLRDLVHTAVHFLDNVIEINAYALPHYRNMAQGTRKLGLGVMGFADMLFALGISYNSEAAISLGKKIMKYITTAAREKSIQLVKDRGVFTYWEGSEWHKKKIRVRNATLTGVSPTGSISMIADVSPSIEPNYALVYVKRVMGGTELLYVNKYFERVAKERGFFSEKLMREIAIRGSIQHIKGIPADVKEIFVTTMDITPEWHVRMQAAFQSEVDAAVSKTVNLPATATVDEVERIYHLAYDLGCKGITIYRDSSMGDQVLSFVQKNVKQERQKEEKTCKKCGAFVQDSCPACKA